MVTTLDFAQNLSLCHCFEKLLVHQEVVQTFPNIFFSVPVFDLPPCIDPLRRVQPSEGVYPPFIQEVLETGAFLVGKARLLVSLRSDVDV